MRHIYLAPFRRSCAPRLGGGGGALLGKIGGGMFPGTPNPDPISDPKMSFPTPAFRPGLKHYWLALGHEMT